MFHVKHEELFRREFGDRLSGEAIGRLGRHAELLKQWNRVVRLVGEDSPAVWVRRHYAESVAARAYWSRSKTEGDGSSLLDLGSGAGFPGLVLAALHPERSVVLVEARERKAAFLAEAVRELELPRVRVVRERVGPESAGSLAGAVEFVALRGVRLPKVTLARLIEALPGGGRLMVWAGRELAPGLAAMCSVEEEVSLPDSRHRRLLLLRPIRRG
ncbi:MAG: class I SAM-dependent methyltransferase [Acidobacteria bacterium]|nr:class I SAM-dependent methyltransferase [Acidobacteriota bacterium]